MNNWIFVGSLVLTFAVSSLGADSVPPISVTIGAQAQMKRPFGDTVIEIHITNVTNRRVTVQTTDFVPPVHLVALDEKGNMAILTVPAPKDRTTRNSTYTLEANETKTYAAPIRDLLRRGETLPDQPPSGAVTVRAILAIIESSAKATTVNQVFSNTITLTP